nr:MAG TPA: hypothetical protein [Caudoviricetes sp.]
MFSTTKCDKRKKYCIISRCILSFRFCNARTRRT